MRLGTLLVVVGSDGGASALERAAILAERFGSTLALAVRPPPPGADRPSSWAVEDRAAAVRARGIPVAIRQLRGSGCDDIAAAALASEADLVVKAVERRPPWPRLPRSNSDRELIRVCDRPLWLIQPAGVGATRVVLAGIDPQGDDAPGAALDREVLGAAGALADGLGISLHVGHAWNAWVMPPLGRVRVDFAREMEILRAERAATLRRISSCAARAGVVVPAHRLHLARGDPRTVLLDLAASLRADTLVLGSVGLRGLRRWLVGNLAERLISGLPCSLLAVSRSPVVVGARRPAAVARPARPQER